MNILVAAATMGTVRALEVCEYVQLDVSTLSRNVPFRLTPQGRTLLEKAVSAWRGAQQPVKKVLGNGFVEAVVRPQRTGNTVCQAIRRSRLEQARPGGLFRVRGL